VPDFGYAPGFEPGADYGSVAASGDAFVFGGQAAVARPAPAQGDWVRPAPAEGDWFRPADVWEPALEPAEPDAEALSGSAAGRDHAPRGAAWQLVRVGVPAAVIVTVGAGAFMMLTGKSNEILASSANQRTQAAGLGTASGKTGSSGSTGSSGTTGLAQGVFGGYPGQRGTITVSSIATAGGTQLAAGSADGHPAIWHRDPNGTWALASASQPAVYAVSGTEGLTGIAHGKAGWIAVGGTPSGSTQRPIVLTSADGVTWHALPQADLGGGGLAVHAVAAGPDGYAVVGQQVSGDRQFAAMWWSTDLVHWTRANNGNLYGGTAASDVYAVTATPTGFVAVGSHGDDAAIWTTTTGLSWITEAFQPPAGGTTAILHAAAAIGSTVVTAGNSTTKTGTAIPFALVSPDGGRTWRGAMLPAPGGSANVTELTASGASFTAVGQATLTGHETPVKWTSPDGLTWTESATTG
jgi:hypothetical protein